MLSFSGDSPIRHKHLSLIQNSKPTNFQSCVARNKTANLTDFHDTKDPTMPETTVCNALMSLFRNRMYLEYNMMNFYWNRSLNIICINLWFLQESKPNQLRSYIYTSNLCMKSPQPSRVRRRRRQWWCGTHYWATTYWHCDFKLCKYVSKTWFSRFSNFEIGIDFRLPLLYYNNIATVGNALHTKYKYRKTQQIISELQSFKC